MSRKKPAPEPATPFHAPSTSPVSEESSDSSKKEISFFKDSGDNENNETTNTPKKRIDRGEIARKGNILAEKSEKIVLGVITEVANKYGGEWDIKIHRNWYDLYDIEVTARKLPGISPKATVRFTIDVKTSFKALPDADKILTMAYAQTKNDVIIFYSHPLNVAYIFNPTRHGLVKLTKRTFLEALERVGWYKMRVGEKWFRM